MFFSGSLLLWFKSFLSNRTQFVTIGDSKSHLFAIPSGVPQGGHCSPTLFNLVANVIATQIETVKASFYADDSKLAMSISSAIDCGRLQQECDRFTGMCSSLGLKLNEGKCKTMTFIRSRALLVFNYEINSTPIESFQVQQSWRYL